MTLNCIFLVGRPGLDPGTLGLKVLVKALRHVASSRTASQNCRWKPQFDGLIDTGWNEVRRTATHLLGRPTPMWLMPLSLRNEPRIATGPSSMVGAELA